MEKQRPQRTQLQQIKHNKLKENREKLRIRKARTHRLIVRGALAEKAIPNASAMSDDEFEKALFRAIEIADYYTNYIHNRSGKAPSENPPEGSCGSNPR